MNEVDIRSTVVRFALFFFKLLRIKIDLLYMFWLLSVPSRTFYSYRNGSFVGEGLQNLGLCLVITAIEQRDLYLVRSDGTTVR